MSRQVIEMFGELKSLAGDSELVQLTQPLTPMLKIKPANDIAQAKLKASRERAQQTKNDVALRVHQLYYKVLIAQLALRTESNRVLQQQLLQGTALSSQADLATAQQFDAKTLLRQSQLDYTQANDEIIHVMGRTPE